MKKRRFYFELLPEDIQAKIKFNYENCPVLWFEIDPIDRWSFEQYLDEGGSSGFFISAFDFKASPEGLDFWAKLFLSELERYGKLFVSSEN